MQQETADFKLSYQGDMGDGSSVYHMIWEGRPVFEARVSKDEEGMPIYIRAINGQTWTKTASRAFAVEDGSRISAMTMKEAVYGNLPHMLADLLVGPVVK